MVRPPGRVPASAASALAEGLRERALGVVLPAGSGLGVTVPWPARGVTVPPPPEGGGGQPLACLLSCCPGCFGSGAGIG